MQRDEFVQLCLVLQGSVRWTGPAAPCAEGSVDPSVVGLPIHVEVCFHKMCSDRLLIQRVGGHLVSRSRACVLEARKLSPVMNGDDQLPDREQHHSNQQDAADHCKQHHHCIGPPATLWLFQSCEDGSPARVLRIGELHDTVVVCLKEAEHSSGVLRIEALHGDDFILAQALASLVVCEPS